MSLSKTLKILLSVYFILVYLQPHLCAGEPVEKKEFKTYDFSRIESLKYTVGLSGQASKLKTKLFYEGNDEESDSEQTEHDQPSRPSFLGETDPDLEVMRLGKTSTNASWSTRAVWEITPISSTPTAQRRTFKVNCTSVKISYRDNSTYFYYDLTNPSQIAAFQKSSSNQPADPVFNEFFQRLFAYVHLMNLKFSFEVAPNGQDLNLTGLPGNLDWRLQNDIRMFLRLILPELPGEGLIRKTTWDDADDCSWRVTDLTPGKYILGEGLWHQKTNRTKQQAKQLDLPFIQEINRAKIAGFNWGNLIILQHNFVETDYQRMLAPITQPLAAGQLIQGGYELIVNRLKWVKLVDYKEKPPE
ncbi:MAG: hypothetical protein AAB019_10000, partial [Planctomycetota bacterium]